MWLIPRRGLTSSSRRPAVEVNVVVQVAYHGLELARSLFRALAAMET